jgi:UDP-GlcNAc:undecaprenyl-phosphate GlcNAc-1-phosphate transferase
MRRRVLWQVVIGTLLVILLAPPVKSAYFNSGLRWQYILIFSFIAAYFLTPFCRTIALKRNIMDYPDWRKNHEKSTPLLGGLAVFLAFSFSLMVNGVFLPGMKSLVVGSLLIFVLGLWDDIHSISALLRFTFQILISIFVIISGGIYLTLFKQFPGSEIFNFFLTVLWMVGLTNAMNFFDGIDGLAAGLSIISAIFLGIIAFKTGQPALGWLAVAIVGSCVGFMPHNFKFGKSTDIFLGDSGSTFLGFILAGLAVLGEWSKTSDFVSFTAPVLIFGVLIFDMVYVTASRIKNRTAKNSFGFLAKANKDHFHHRLLFMGFKRKEAAFTIFTISTCLGVSALIIMDQKFIDALLGLFQAGLVLGIVAVLMFKGRDISSREISGLGQDD